MLGEAMTRKEAMTVITQRLGHIHTGSTGASVEALIYIVQTVAAAEREAILKLTDSLGWVNSDDIRARGEV
jgi:hypothetical protein